MDLLIRQLIFGGALMAAETGGGASPPSPPPTPAAAAADDDDDDGMAALSGISISKVHGKDQFIAYDAGEDQVALIRKRPVDKGWTIRLYEYPELQAGEFTSATAAKAFVAGLYAGINLRSVKPVKQA